jgi:isopenicillin-N N-acyltransferase like protein
MMCLGSLGSPGAYSSGMNAAGLALADTQIGAEPTAVGWLRYFLMTRLLATCADGRGGAGPDLRDAPCRRRIAGHGRCHGATAAVELGADQVVAATRGALSWRTNHFLSAELAARR